jgi:hypothetical protein
MAKRVEVDIKTRGADKASKDLGKVDKGLGRLAKSAGVAAAGFFGARALIAGFQSVISLTKQQVLAEAQLNAVLKSTAGVAGVTAKELTNMASALQKQTRFGDEAIIKAQSLMLTFTKVGKEVFPDAIEAVLNMSEAMGQDLQQGVIQVGKALNDPILGVTALRRVGVQLSKQQEDLVKKFTNTGEIAKAQKIILSELETQFGGVAKAAGETMAGSLDKMNNAAGDAAESLGQALAPVIIPMAKHFTEAAIGVSEFFKRLTETELETRIRELQELGIETEHLERRLRLERLQTISGELKGNKSIKDLKEENRNLDNETTSLIIKQQGLIDERIPLLEKYNAMNVTLKEDERARLKELNNEINTVLPTKIEENQKLIEQNEKQVELLQEQALLLSRPTINSIVPETDDDITGDPLDFDFAGMAEPADTFYQHIKDEEASFTEWKKKQAETQKKIDDEVYKNRIQNNLEAAIIEGQSAKEAGVSVIKAEVAKSTSSLITKIMQALPFPVNLAVAAGAGGMIGKVTDSLFSSFATGGSFVTKGRTTLPIGNGVVVGDNASGMERVDVTPLPSPTSNGNNITINISAPLVDETVVDHIIPAIRRAEKLNL